VNVAEDFASRLGRGAAILRVNDLAVRESKRAPRYKMLINCGNTIPGLCKFAKFISQF
jgi:hypothetical protein